MKDAEASNVNKSIEGANGVILPPAAPRSRRPFGGPEPVRAKEIRWGRGLTQDSGRAAEAKGTAPVLDGTNDAESACYPGAGRGRFLLRTCGRAAPSLSRAWAGVGGRPARWWSSRRRRALLVGVPVRHTFAAHRDAGRCFVRRVAKIARLRRAVPRSLSSALSSFFWEGGWGVDFYFSCLFFLLRLLASTAPTHSVAPPCLALSSGRSEHRGFGVTLTIAPRFRPRLQRAVVCPAVEAVGRDDSDSRGGLVILFL